MANYKLCHVCTDLRTAIRSDFESVINDFFQSLEANLSFAVSESRRKSGLLQRDLIPARLAKRSRFVIDRNNDELVVATGSSISSTPEFDTNNHHHSSCISTSNISHRHHPDLLVSNSMGVVCNGIAAASSGGLSASAPQMRANSGTNQQLLVDELLLNNTTTSTSSVDQRGSRNLMIPSLSSSTSTYAAVDNNNHHHSSFIQQQHHLSSSLLIPKRRHHQQQQLHHSAATAATAAAAVVAMVTTTTTSSSTAVDQLPVEIVVDSCNNSHRQHQQQDYSQSSSCIVVATSPEENESPSSSPTTTTAGVEASATAVMLNVSAKIEPLDNDDVDDEVDFNATTPNTDIPANESDGIGCDDESSDMIYDEIGQYLQQTDAFMGLLNPHHSASSQWKYNTSGMIPIDDDSNSLYGISGGSTSAPALTSFDPSRGGYHINRGGLLSINSLEDDDADLDAASSMQWGASSIGNGLSGGVFGGQGFIVTEEMKERAMGRAKSQQRTKDYVSFASFLFRELFSDEELMGGTFTGRSRPPLDPDKVMAIRQATVEHFRWQTRKELVEKWREIEQCVGSVSRGLRHRQQIRLGHRPNSGGGGASASSASKALSMCSGVVTGSGSGDHHNNSFGSLFLPGGTTTTGNHHNVNSYFVSSS